MNLPNKLTVLRVLLVPIFVFFLMAEFVPHNILIALLVFVIASITDFYDGMIARRDNLISDFGKFADPLADKILVMSALICFASLGTVNVWFVILIMFREFAVTSVRLVAAGNGKVIAANMLGKIKTVSQIVAIIAVLIFAYIEYILAVYFTRFWLENLYIADLSFVLCQIFMAVATFFSLYSGYVYVKENWDSIKQMK